MLVEAYGEYSLRKSQYFERFKIFKSGDFDVRNISEKVKRRIAARTWRNYLNWTSLTTNECLESNLACLKPV